MNGAKVATQVGLSNSLSYDLITSHFESGPVFASRDFGRLA